MLAPWEMCVLCVRADALVRCVHVCALYTAPPTSVSDWRQTSPSHRLARCQEQPANTAHCGLLGMCWPSTCCFLTLLSAALRLPTCVVGAGDCSTCGLQQLICHMKAASHQQVACSACADVCGRMYTPVFLVVLHRSSLGWDLWHHIR